MDALMYLKLCAQIKFARFLREENGEVNIVATVVLIGIAVLLAVVFKDGIIALLEKLFKAITTTSTNAVEGK